VEIVKYQELEGTEPRITKREAKKVYDRIFEPEEWRVKEVDVLKFPGDWRKWTKVTLKKIGTREESAFPRQFAHAS